MPWFRRQLCLPGAFFAGRRTGCSEEASGQPWARWGRQPSPSADTQCPHEPLSLPPVPTSGQPDFWGLWHPQNRVPEEGRARFPRCLPNSRIRRELGKKLAGGKKNKKISWESQLRVESIWFFAASCPQVWELGNSAPKVPFFALPDLLVAARGELWGFLLFSCLCFGESGFCAAGCITASWSPLGARWVFWYRSRFLWTSVALRALTLRLKQRRNLRFRAAVPRGSADPERFRGSGRCKPSWGPAPVSSRRGPAAKMGFAAYPGHLFKFRLFWHPWNCLTTCERAPCHASRWARMSWQPRAWDVHLAEGSESWAPRCSCPNTHPSRSYRGKSGHGGGVSGLGTGCFPAGGILPTVSPWFLPLHRWGRGSFRDVFSPSSPICWGQPAPTLSRVLQRLTLKATAQQFFFLTTSARWFPTRGWLLPEVNPGIKGLNQPLRGFAEIVTRAFFKT